MPTNEFISYATAGGALNVEALPTYALGSIRLNGAVSGLADAKYANRAWRQGANMASAIGECIIHKTPYSALDDGNITQLRDNIEAMIAKIAQEQYASPGTTQQAYAASTTFLVPDGVTRMFFRLWGGGGGGGGNTSSGGGGGGGGGGYAEGWVAVTPGETLTYTVGGPGSPGSNSGGSSAANSGGHGGDTQIKRGATVLLQANGGRGGQGSMAGGQGDSGPGGVGTIGTVLMTGGAGNAGFAGGAAGFGGIGGAAAGGGGNGAASSGLPSAGSVPGGGGAGGGGNFGGAQGAAGMIVAAW